MALTITELAEEAGYSDQFPLPDEPDQGEFHATFRVIPPYRLVLSVEPMDGKRLPHLRIQTPQEFDDDDFFYPMDQKLAAFLHLHLKAAEQAVWGRSLFEGHGSGKNIWARCENFIVLGQPKRFNVKVIFLYFMYRRRIRMDRGTISWLSTGLNWAGRMCWGWNWLHIWPGGRIPPVFPTAFHPLVIERSDGEVDWPLLPGRNVKGA